MEQHEALIEQNFMPLSCELIKDNLIIGELLSYKEICTRLNQPYYNGGNQKKAQLKEFARYFEYEHCNRKILITDIYDNELPPEAPTNVIYVNHIEKILLQYLSLQEGYETYITSKKLWLTLGMINYNFIDFQDKYKRESVLKKLDDHMTDFEINDFYERCYNKFNKILTSALNSLQKRRLIEYHITYMVQDESDGDDGRPRPVFAEEVAEILGIERETLLEMGYEKEIQVHLSRKSEQYRKKIDKKAHEQLHYSKLFKCYHIIYKQEYVIQALSDEDKRFNKLVLNDKVITGLNVQAASKYANTDIQYKNNETNFHHPRYYLSMQGILSEKLIRLYQTDLEKEQVKEYIQKEEEKKLLKRVN